MISGIFHQGSGIGNQLHRYVATKVLALAIEHVTNGEFQETKWEKIIDTE